MQSFHQQKVQQFSSTQFSGVQMAFVEHALFHLERHYFYVSKCVSLVLKESYHLVIWYIFLYSIKPIDVILVLWRLFGRHFSWPQNL